MFSGIVEEMGQVIVVHPSENYTTLQIKADKVLVGTQIGDSIAVNGVCLTVTSFTPQDFTVQAVPETLAKTALSQLSVDHPVNLERAITLQSRIGGHLVQGHVDTASQFLRFITERQGTLAEFNLPACISTLVVEKGYIAIDGMSLTIASLTKTTFGIALIPHTLQHTIAQFYQPGQWVSLEADMMGKYVARLMQNSPYSS